MKEKENSSFVRLNPLLKKNCHYNLLVGERSNGKTYCVLDYILENYCKTGNQSVYLRRWDEDLKTKLTVTLCDGLVRDKLVEKYTGGEYNGIRYYNAKWYLTKTYITTNNKGEKIEKTESQLSPFMIGFTISSDEHNKGATYPKIRTIFFDEFISRTGYLTDEFICFMNTLSTLIRLRDDIKIFMCGNTINPYTPYFKEFGITNIKNMKKGDIDVYTYGESGLRLGIYMTDSLPKGMKKSNVYFAFNNPRLSMITGEGNIWDVGIFPHCPVKYRPCDVMFNFFIEFDNNLYHGEVVYTGQELFIFIHIKTTPIQSPQSDLLYTLDNSASLATRHFINKPISQIEKLVATLFQQQKVFYQDNEVGNAIQNFLQETSKKYSRL